MTHFPDTFYLPDNGLDDVLEYISQLRIDDIEDLQGRHDSTDDTSLTDAELAKLIFAQEAEALLNITRDHMSGPSVSDSQTLLEELIAMEEMARFDHEMALALYEERPLPVRPEPRPQQRTRNVRELVEDNSDTSSVASSSGISDSSNELEDPPKAPEEPRVPIDCTICGELITGTVVRALCDHPYDTECLQVLFRKATMDESLFPPSCCQISIPLSDVEEHFDKDLTALFQKKAVEFSTPDRAYCFQPTCSAFLGPASATPSSLMCSECASSTCGACKQEAHIDLPCSAHLDRDVLSLAKDLGWQRCYSCKHVVELNHGCFHITCMCKAQFCYLCATPWKSCSCPQFDEARL